jgi:hypothetical protein
MHGPEIPDSRESEVEIEVEPTVTARIARWLERARILGRRIEAAVGYAYPRAIGYAYP